MEKKTAQLCINLKPSTKQKFIDNSKKAGRSLTNYFEYITDNKILVLDDNAEEVLKRLINELNKIKFSRK